MQINIKNLELHGSDLRSINFNFMECCIDLFIDPVKSTNNSYQQFLIKFMEPSKVEISNISSISESEIFRLNIQDNTDNSKTIRIIFLEGFGEKDFELVFECSKIEIKEIEPLENQ